MRAISLVRTSRTVIDATTSSRASFALTLLRRMSPIFTAGLPVAPALCVPVFLRSWLSCLALLFGSLGLIHAPALCCPPGSEQPTETIHELHDRLQVDPRPGLGRGMAGARRSRRLLSSGRQIRHDRSHL